MRTLFVGALAATLVGCSCYVSPQTGFEACTGGGGNWFACSDRTAISLATEPDPASTDAEPVKPATKSKIAARTERPKTEKRKPEKPKPEKPASARANDETHPAMANAEPAATATPVEPARSNPPSEGSDPILAKAKLTIAAKLENPASAEFGQMKRAVRTNMLGQSVDTICGSVKGRKTSGEGTGERPFLYLVKDDEAFVVDGSPTSAAATAFRNICN